MRQLFLVGNVFDGVPRQGAIIRAESGAKACAKARQLGLAEEDNYFLCRVSEDIPAGLIDRLLSDGDGAELKRLFRSGAIGRRVSMPPKKLAQEPIDVTDQEALNKSLIGVDDGSCVYTQRDEASPPEYFPDDFLDRELSAAVLEEFRQIGPLCDDAQKARLKPGGSNTMRDVLDELVVSLDLK